MNQVLLALALLPGLCNAQWVQVGNDINGDVAGARSGTASALSADGSIIAIGAPNNSTVASNAGQVRVFEWAGSAWSPVGAAINGASSGDLAGWAVRLSDDGSRLAIGEPFNNDLGFVTGQVRVFENVGGSWVQLGSVLSGETLQAAAGTALDLSADGSIVAVGAPNTAVNGIPFAGNVRVFELQDDAWVQRGSAIGGDGSIIKFGQSTSLSADGNTLAIGQTGDPTDGDTGRVYVYRFIDGDWLQLGDSIRGASDNDEFGNQTRLSASGEVLAIGTYTSDVVKVFQLIGDAWIPMGDAILSETAGDSFGYSIDLSDDGTTLVASARFNDLAGTNAGRVYVFRFTAGTWTQVNSPIDGEAAADQFGRSVCISGDGSRWAAGASGNSTGGVEAGHVRVFENASGLGVASMDNAALFSVFPNPAADRVVIRGDEAVLSYTLLTLDGKVIREENVNFSKEFQVSLEGVEQGTYLMRLDCPSRVHFTTVLKL